jgi:hypothetical protein
MGSLCGSQSPIVDEPTGVDVLPDSCTLCLIGVEAIPEGSEHVSRFVNRVFEVRDFSLS